MRALVGVLGLVLGLVVGTCLVLANPLGWINGLPPLPADIAPSKAYRLDDYRGIGVGLTDLLGVGRTGPEAALTDPALLHTRVAIVVLPAGEGTTVALAVKVSVLAEENSLWLARLGTHDYWNVFWLGEGSIFASGYSNFWGLTRDSLVAAVRGDDWASMATEYPLSARAPLGESTGVTGAAGRYSGFTGEIREFLYPAPPGSANGSPDWGLALKVNPSPVTAR